ncbi:DsrE family protein [Halobium salinum]|uniref:DsrE family protein n=1 Tax=Halobium salinum TaxID=1364940 RepID=A0ABD5PFW0_9EURY|nr:DsrE family protein [Halobium salinum]
MKTVFHLVQADEQGRETTLTIANNLTEDDQADIEEIAVVAQADGAEPVTTGGTGSETVETLLSKGVSVKICSNTMDLKELEESDLVDGVETVSSGGAELTRLQADDYAYIRP